MQKPVTRFVRTIMPAVAIVLLSACGDLLGSPEPEPHVIGPISVEGFMALANGDDPTTNRTMDYNDAVVGIKADGSEHVIRDGDIFRGYLIEAGRTFLFSSSLDFYGCGTVEVIEGQPADCFDPTFGSIHSFTIQADGSFVYAGHDFPPAREWGHVFVNQIRRMNPDGSIEILFEGDDWEGPVVLDDGTVVAPNRQDPGSLYAATGSGPEKIFSAPDVWPELLGSWDGHNLYLRQMSEETIWTFDMERLELDPVPYIGRGSAYDEVVHDLDELPGMAQQVRLGWTVGVDNMVILEQYTMKGEEHVVAISQVYPQLVLYEPELEAVTAWTSRGEHVYVAGRNAAGKLEVLVAEADAGDFSTVLESDGAATSIAVTADGKLLLAHTNPAGPGGLLTIMDLESGAADTFPTESPLMNMQAY